jgi:hypothetical protein
MNILVDKLPTDYEGLKINTNFRSFILFELLMQDRNVDKEDKIALALDLFYDEFPQDIKKAFDGILWFYTRGKDRKEQKNGEKADKNNKKKIYSFEHDADLIYTAFLDQYRLDLNDVDYLHWFKFKAMFEGLKAENKICEIMGYRAIDVGKIKDKEEKKRYKKLQREWALPDDRTEEEKERDFADAFW